MDVKITGTEELQEYMNSLELYGDGGTDFRPAFAYVEELMEKREFENLKGLVYFTDGKNSRCRLRSHRFPPEISVPVLLNRT